jgi:XTP/dITP diphosphohydrolase
MAHHKADLFKTIPHVRVAMAAIQPLWFLTGNKGKLKEAKRILGPLGFDVKALEINGQIPEVIEPQASILEEIALSKLTQAREILNALGKGGDAVMVEDAGLFINSFDGFPGVYSSYVHSTIGSEGILRLMNNNSDRRAEFRALAALWDGKKIHIGSGICPGHIADSQVSGNGFGYDPIFIPCDLDSNGEPLGFGTVGMISTDGIPFGGTSIEVKEKFSHRRRALQALILSLGRPSA